MPQIDVADETWIAAPQRRVAARVADPECWHRWWPELTLTLDELRGPEGVRWFVSGPATGSMEVWLEPDHDGVRVHYFLRLDTSNGRRLSPRRVQRVVLAHRRRAKRVFWALKDEFEVHRPTGGNAGR
jgi:hypothetical protein